MNDFSSTWMISLTLGDLSFTIVCMTKQTPHEEAAIRVADEVRAELARQRKTAAELAAVLGIGQHTVGTRLKGAVPFNVVELIATASWLGVSVSELAVRAERAEKKPAA